MLYGIVYGIGVLSLAVYTGLRARGDARLRLWGGIWWFFFGGLGHVFIYDDSEFHLLVASCLNQLFAAVFLLVAGVGASPLKQSSSQQMIRWGIGSVLIGSAALIVSATSLTIFEYLGVQHQEQGLVTLMMDGESLEKAAALLLIIGLAPLAEELVFRGVIQQSLIRRYDRPVAIVMTGILFGLMHFESWTAVPPLIVFGIVLGWWREHTGWLIFPVLAHFTNNTLAMLLL